MVNEALDQLSESDREPLINALKNQSNDVRGETSIKLGRMKDLRAVEPLVAVLNDEDSWVRVHAGVVLSRMNDPRSIEPLLTALKSDYVIIPTYALDALSEFKDPLVVEILIEALDNRNIGKYWRGYKEEIAKALKKLTEKDFGVKKSKWVKWWEKNKSSFRF